MTEIPREFRLPDDAFERQRSLLSAHVGARHRQRSERQALHSRRFVVLAAAALVAVGATSAFAMRAFFIDKGLVGLPPVGATPSAPESGVLEMYYWLHPLVLNPLVVGQIPDRPSREWSRLDAEVRPRGQSWVYADGRLIRLLYGGGNLPEAANRWTSGFLEQRLTPKGVELLRSEIVSTGLFGHERPCMNFIQVLHGEQRVAPINHKGKFCSKDGTPIAATPHQRHALERLASRLAKPESWLPASAWEQRKIRAYVPSTYAVCASLFVSNNPDPGWRVQQMRPAGIVALLPDSAQEVLRGRDWNATGTEAGCFAVTTKGARSLAKVLDGAGPARKGGAFHLNYTFDAPEPSRQVAIVFEPYLPHGETTCSACG